MLSILKTIYKSPQINFTIKLGIGGIVIIYLYPHLASFASNLKEQSIQFSAQSAILLSACIILSFANWGTEAYKWHKLLNTNHQSEFKRSIKAILQGIILSIITPNRVGEIIGRSISIKENKTAAAAASIASSASQTLTTIIFGCTAISHHLFNNKEEIWGSLLLIINTVCLIGYFFLPNISTIGTKWQYTAKTAKLLSQITAASLAQAFFISTIRYIIFSSQFMIICFALKMNLAFLECYLAIFATFFITTIIPSNLLSELGIRGGASLYCFSFISNNPVLATFSSWILWIINIASPAIIGTALFGLKELSILNLFGKKRNKHC